jgi:hypothetical protein
MQQAFGIGSEVGRLQNLSNTLLGIQRQADCIDVDVERDRKHSGYKKVTKKILTFPRVIIALSFRSIPIRLSLLCCVSE